MLAVSIRSWGLIQPQSIQFRPQNVPGKKLHTVDNENDTDNSRCRKERRLRCLHATRIANSGAPVQAMFLVLPCCEQCGLRAGEPFLGH